MKGLVPSALVLLATTCAGGGAETRVVSIATGGTGGVYYPYGGALANIISQQLPGVNATAEVTGTSVDNLKLLQLGRADLAFTLADTLAAAQAGAGPFRGSGAIGAARTMAVLYTSYTHIVVREGSGIERVRDLRGHVVSVGSPGSGTELIADRLLMAAGLDPRADVTRHALSATESVGAFMDGKVDGFFWTGGLPTPAVEDLVATPGLSVRLLPQDDLLRALQATHRGDGYRLVTIPAATYRGIEADIPVVGATNILVASSQLDEQLAYDIVRLLFERKADLVAAHPEAENLAIPSGPDASPARFHPGAVRYYREHGWQ